MRRRPNPKRSGRPGWAPTRTSLATASSIVRIMVTGSPAWKPQATFAVVMCGITASSAPIDQLPKLSPQSQLMSMTVMTGVSLSAGGRGRRAFDRLPVGVEDLEGLRGRGEADRGTGCRLHRPVRLDLDRVLIDQRLYAALRSADDDVAAA